MNLIVYCIHSRLVLHTDKDNIIRRKELMHLLGATYHIPKELRDKVVEELKACNVVVGSGKGYYIINKHLKPIIAQ